MPKGIILPSLPKTETVSIQTYGAGGKFEITEAPNMPGVVGKLAIKDQYQNTILMSGDYSTIEGTSYPSYDTSTWKIRVLGDNEVVTIKSYPIGASQVKPDFTEVLVRDRNENEFIVITYAASWPTSFVGKTALLINSRGSDLVKGRIITSGTSMGAEFTLSRSNPADDMRGYLKKAGEVLIIGA
jgi:hypothetical protein